MNITVTVDSVDLSSVVGDHQVQTGEDEWLAEPMILADVVAARIAEDIKKDDQYNSLRKRVLEIRDEEIREQLKPMIREAIEQPIQRTTEFGQPQGPPVTVAELVVKEAQNYLTKREGYGRDSLSVAQKLIRDEVDRAIKSELSQAIADEKAKVVAAVRAKAAELIAEAVQQGVGR